MNDFIRELCPSGNWFALGLSQDTQVVGSCFLAWIVLTALPIATAVLCCLSHCWSRRPATSESPRDSNLKKASILSDETLDGLNCDGAESVKDVLQSRTWSVGSLARLRTISPWTLSLHRCAQLIVAVVFTASLAYGAAIPGVPLLAMTWQIVHALFSTVLAVTMARVPPSRSFQIVVVTAVDAMCFLVYLRSSLVGVTGISTGHALPIVQSSLAVAIFIACVLVYHHATTLAQNAILAASSDNKLTPSLEPFASLWQRATFSWLTPLMHRGSRHALQLGDLWDLVGEDTSAVVLESYHRHARQGRSVIVAALLVLRHLFAIQIVFSVLGAVTKFCGPFYLNRLLAFLERDNSGAVRASALEPYLYLVGLFVGSLLTSVFQGQGSFVGRRVGTQLRATLTALLYQKLLTLNPKLAIGEEKQDINVLIGADVARIVEYFATVQSLVTTPLQIFIAVAGLYAVVGWSVMVGVGVMVFMLVLQWWTGRLVENLQTRLMATTDVRVKKTEEVLQGIRVIKYFAWERPFAAALHALRDLEMHALRRYWLTMCAIHVLYHAGEILVTFLTFVAYTRIAGHDLDATTVFSCISLFNTLRTPMWDLPDLAIRFLETKVSVQRLHAYLGGTDVSNYTIDTSDAMTSQCGPVVDQKELSGIYIGAINATLSWSTPPSATPDTVADVSSGGLKDEKNLTTLLSPSFMSSSTLATITATSKADLAVVATQSTQFQLKNINLSIPRGKLTVILGATGSGKTMLLHALLGELVLERGQVFMPHTRVAYVPQQSWLLNATVKTNVLFGAVEDRKRYQRVIEACALEHDLLVLEAGENTQIGEKGVALSGGQKSRLSLARACYADTDVVVLDDILSAVDAPTAAHLLSHCILGELAGRTRILVTHNVGLVAAWADHLIYLKDGRVEAEAESIAALAAQLGDAAFHDDANLLTDYATPMTLTRAPSVASLEITAVPSVKNLAIPAQDDDEAKSSDTQPVIGTHKLIHDEERAQGSVAWGVYATYVRHSGGIWRWVLLLGTMAIPQFLDLAQQWWIERWAQTYSAPPRPDAQSASTSAVDVSYFLLGYMGLCLANIFVQNAFNVLEMFRSMTASRKLHDMLLQSILGAPMTWFDSTPVGRVLNRFKDIQTVDRDLIPTITFTAYATVSVLITLGVVASIAPLFIVAMIPVLVMFGSVARTYLASSREIKRLESVTRSPIFSGFQETGAGTTVIRAFREEPAFTACAHAAMDTHNRASWWLWVSSAWLAIRLDFLSNVTVMACGILILIQGNISAGFAGLAMTWSMTISDACSRFVYWLSLMEMNMNSVERILEYSDLEGESSGGTTPAPDEWPTDGAIKVTDLVVQYPSAATPVLQDVSFTLWPREKCGVVGRTGAGKSSLALALLRMIEPRGGFVEIDGLCTSDLDLATLRSRVTIVPQDPVLFEGTLRSNLDVFGEFDDTICWTALERVYFFESTLPASDSTAASDNDAPLNPDLPSAAAVTATWTLESKIDAGGKNLSVGQRQLLSLARALVRQSKVVILDESTANVSNDLDAKIQRTIRGTALSNATILCIAHRLRTIADFDKVLVLDRGRVVEFGTPAELLRNQDGVFHHMCRESGEFDYLQALATRGSASGLMGSPVYATAPDLFAESGEDLED
ncbi:hypothetical protein GGF31_006825 [Allomyces arbusculus]|nr:hypothetical protein GGF31_006825 [Allomyces arbusculus]